jgi:hypothetical protein
MSQVQVEQTSNLTALHRHLHLYPLAFLYPSHLLQVVEWNEDPI